MQRPPLPPFTAETAAQKVRAAEDGWNTRNPDKIALAYSPNSQWRNRSQFINGRAEIVAFLTDKWSGEGEYRLIKELFAHDGNRIGVRINDVAIAESERLFHWPQGRRPDDHPGLSELGL